MTARIRAALAHREAGTTLTEVLVAMLIMSIVVIATASLTIGFGRTTAQNTARQDQIDVARTAVERMSKTTRTAVKPSQLLASCESTCAQVDSFLQGTTTSMKFYANLDNVGNSVGPSQITYTIGTSGADAGVLIEKVQIPDFPQPTNGNSYSYCNAEAVGASADCKKRLTVRRLATGVVLSASEPTFSYFRADGSPLSATGSGLSAADLERVMAIEIRLKVRSSSSSAPAPTTYIQRITLPNAQAILQGEDTTP